MAVDTRDKRFSLMGFGLPVPRILPDPDATVDDQDRYHHLYLYAGITISGAPTETILDYERGFARGFMRGFGI